MVAKKTPKFYVVYYMIRRTTNRKDGYQKRLDNHVRKATLIHSPFLNLTMSECKAIVDVAHKLTAYKNAHFKIVPSDMDFAPISFNNFIK